MFPFILATERGVDSEEKDLSMQYGAIRKVLTLKRLSEVGSEARVAAFLGCTLILIISAAGGGRGEEHRPVHSAEKSIS